MFRRQTVSFALAGAAVAAFLALTDRPAQALTIENYGSGASDARSGWVDLNYNDPNKKSPRDGDKRSLDSGPRVFFGPSNSANQNFNPNHYFSPNYLMGK